MASLNKTPLLSAMSGKNSLTPYRKTQYFATFSAALVTFSMGMILGYLSPASYQIRNTSGIAHFTDVRSDLESRLLMSSPISTEISTPSLDEISTDSPASNSYPTAARISAEYPSQKWLSELDADDTEDLNYLLARSKRLASGPENEDFIKSISLKKNIPHSQAETSAHALKVPTVVLKNESYKVNSSEGEEGEKITMTVDELAWFSSSVTLGAIVGFLLGSLIQNWLGRRGSILAAIFPGISGWFLIGFGESTSTLIAGRVFTGLYIGCAMLSAVIYVAEVSSPEIRGLLTIFVDLSLSLGKLFVVILGAFTQWQDLALASTAPMFLLFLCMVFCKESPSHLINKEKYDAARASLQYFRGPGADVSTEYESLKTYQLEETKNKFTYSHLRQAKIYKPLAIVLIVGIFVQLSGIDMFSFNLASIFEQSGSRLSDSGCSIVAICFQVIGNAVGVICIETTGRKKLLIVSSVGMAISHVCLGAYFFALHFSGHWAKHNIFWLPLLAVIFFMLTFSIGFGPVPLVLIGEMFPPSVRETAAGLAGATIFATAFVIIISYDAMQTALTLGGFYWLFAIFCMLAGTFSALFVKETKGKTLQEVSAIFAGGSSNYIALEPTQGPKLDGNPIVIDQNSLQNSDQNVVEKDLGVSSSIS